MLKGSRDAVLRKMQPISIHGQLSYDLHYLFADELDGQTRVARGLKTANLTPSLRGLKPSKKTSSSMKRNSRTPRRSS